MGSACCVAARDGDLSIRTINDRFERNMRHSPSWSFINDRFERNVRRSPSWSFRWENRRRVAGEIDDPSDQLSRGTIVRDYSTEIKRSLSSNKGVVSDSGSLHESFGSPISFKSPFCEGMGGNSFNQHSDTSVESKYSMVKDVSESSDVADLSAPKVSFYVNSSSPTLGADNLLAHSHPLAPGSTPSRKVCISPGHRLLRQISDSRIHGLKSPGDYSFSEGRASSQGGSSDGWSMRAFSELVASSQRERWSFESELLSTGFGKISGCSSRFSCSPSLDVQTCGACSKALAQSPSWTSGALTVVAVLVCGHAYHADCLESITLEVDRYDPACPICVGGDKQLKKISGKASKAFAKLKERGRKISKSQVKGSCVSSDSDDWHHCQHAAIRKGDTSMVGTSTSAASSSTKPFLKRHFSFGSRWSRSLSENDTRRKRGFWSRHR